MSSSAEPVGVIFFHERDAPAVSDQPLVPIRPWRMIQSARLTRHLLMVLDSGSLRLTSPLSRIELSTMRVATQSGREYELLGPPQTEGAAYELMKTYASAALLDALDVSDLFWSELQFARRQATAAEGAGPELVFNLQVNT